MFLILHLWPRGRNGAASREGDVVVDDDCGVSSALPPNSARHEYVRLRSGVSTRRTKDGRMYDSEFQVEDWNGCVCCDAESRAESRRGGGEAAAATEGPLGALAHVLVRRFFGA